MLEITTKKTSKSVEIDGFGFDVRKPGAGEALTMQKASREMTKISKVKEMTDEQEQRVTDLTIGLLNICLSLFKAHTPEGQEYVEKLDVEVLMDVIRQVFEAKDESETEAA